MNELTLDQRNMLNTIGKLVIPRFKHFYATENAILAIGIQGESLATFDSWQALAYHLRDKLNEWYTKTQRELGAIENEPNTALDRHYAARAADLFGDHAMLNQDSETDGY